MQNTNSKRLFAYVPDYVVFDLETTGLNAARDSIIEISALKVENRVITDTFSTLVNPECAIPYHATEINGITSDMVVDAPLIEEALANFLVFSEGQVLVGHNIHTFDLNFVNHFADRLFNKTIENDYIDTLYMSRSCLPQLKSHKLTALAEYFKISAEGAHRAMNDCIMNQKCYEELGEIQGGMHMELCPKCSGELKKRSGKYGSFWGCSNYPKCRYTKKI